MSYLEAPLINWSTFADTRATLGTDFVRILGYFREDGTKSVDTIEAAMRERSAAKLVLPAHTLKGESWQFGAEQLAMLAEKIETTARHCVETQQEPDELLEDIVGLRDMFQQSLAALEKEANPLVERRSFGRRSATAGAVMGTQRSFGRG
ncbi:Hpt domain-containing protein [Blastomonas sp.]|uniref:Hpt domain-containing protein n=1 Tax=Blastomonas sp. TaxID=1909299 RepID=UPI002609193C|nr:Hpt domain-containing protein [Blastomonas sp.]MDM7957339.1 Hpt domain-containing protein [Blastomonas sp.]